MTFGEYLKSLRTAKKITLIKAAKMLHISTGYLSSLESGNRSAPSFELQQTMADALDLTDRQRYQLYDLAAESRKELTLANDINKYIYQNPEIRIILRYSMERCLNQKDWENIRAYITHRYPF